MFYYRLNNKVLLSNNQYHNLELISEEQAAADNGTVYILNRLDPLRSRKSFSVSHPSLAFPQSEGLELLLNHNNHGSRLPEWLVSKIDLRKVTSLNTSYPDWQDILNYSPPQKWRVNIVGLGDVGGTLGIGLRLLGGEYISRIGLYDIDENKIKRWECELGQIMPAFGGHGYPEATCLSDEQLFNCDMFIFCVSVGVPPLGSSVKDVRIAQLEGNSKIIKEYAKKARECNFKGIFAVVSDPVDLLCSVVFKESNTDEDKNYDFKGLSPDKIRCYGLGVMNARAAYYARQSSDTIHYLNEGRVFGPHGQGLVVADSIESYDDELSKCLTEKVKNANMEVRASGFKPFVAPALSSGSLSIIDTIRGAWHYSATFMGGIFMGAKNRLNKSGVEIETLNIPEPLWNRIKNTYESLGNII